MIDSGFEKDVVDVGHRTRVLLGTTILGNLMAYVPTPLEYLDREYNKSGQDIYFIGDCGHSQEKIGLEK